MRFAEAGYRVEVVAVATPAAVSRLSAEMRSLDAGYPAVGRWTPPQAHESALAGSAGVVAALEALPHVQRMQVFSREQLLFDNARTDAGEWAQPAEAADALRREQHRPLDVREAFDWLQDYAAVFTKAQARPGYLGQETAPAYVRLQGNAQTMIHTLTQTPGAPLGQLEREQRARRTHLERALPDGLLPPQRRPAAPPELPDWPEHSGPTSRREPPTLGR
ncbi:zeta toxin family protein [Nesterenkonia sp. CL21]|uniref:zeta toxin family protein n=1 Tax=Nesterenkonia sp. CL21 TaxID=3064894 RepID=UPI0028789D81|nr:zeta toxin family protein [Nesterenkonia sp. CL21]MDS2171461.1 zeta toxin family protein [Nesterenkonia sp. CL21]